MPDVDSNGNPDVAANAVPGSGRPTMLRDRVRSLQLPSPPPASDAARLWLPWTLCGVLALSTSILAVVALRDSPEPAAVPTVSAPSLGPRSTPATTPGAVALEAKGYIIPLHQIKVSPKVSGMVVRLKFEEGQQVKQGDILAELETVDYQADRDRAKAALDAAWHRFLELYTGNRPEEIRQARAELDEAIAERDRWYPEYQRNIALNRTGAVAKRDYEEAISRYQAAERRVERLRNAYLLMLEGPRIEQIERAWAEVAQAEAELTKAQWRLDNCIIRAPVTGTILTKMAEEGNIVNPMAFNVAASLCEMADLSQLEVDLNIQERDVANVFKGQPCRIRSEAFPDREYEGVVSRLMPIADRAKGAVPVRVKVTVPREEEGVYLKPEMSVLVSFLKK